MSLFAKLNPLEIFALNRARAWKTLMLGQDGNLKPDARLVLADLARFCRATSTSFTPGDPHTTAMLEGRRETFNRVVGFLHLDESTIHNLKEEDHE